MNSPLPYYIQLQGPIESLAMFTSSQSQTKLRVKFLRKTGILLHGKDLWISDVLGEQTPSPVESRGLMGDVTQDEHIMAWEGEIMPSTTGQVGTFNAGRLYIKASNAPSLQCETQLFHCFRISLVYPLLLTILANHLLVYIDTIFQ